MGSPANLYSPRGVVPHHTADWPRTNVLPPYSISIADLAHFFTYSTRRLTMFQGLLEVRKSFRARGITGSQWINGSFVQDESIYGRDPDDIDVLTWVSCTSSEHFDQLTMGIDCEAMERECHCHVFFMPALDGQITWPEGAYWLWLFGHTNTEKVVDEKDKGLAKGFFAVELTASEEHLTLGGDHAQA